MSTKDQNKGLHLPTEKDLQKGNVSSFEDTPISDADLIIASLNKIAAEHDKRERAITGRIERSEAKRKQFLSIFKKATDDIGLIIDDVLEQFLTVGDFRDLRQSDRYAEMKEALLDVFEREGKYYSRNFGTLVSGIQVLLHKVALNLLNLANLEHKELLQYSESIVQEFEEKLTEGLSDLFCVDMAMFLRVSPNSDSGKSELKCSVFKHPNNPDNEELQRVIGYMRDKDVLTEEHDEKFEYFDYICNNESGEQKHFRLWDFLNQPIDFLLTPTPDVGADLWIKFRGPEKGIAAVLFLDDVQIELMPKWEDRLIYRTLADFINSQYQQILSISGNIKKFAEARYQKLELEAKLYISDQENFDLKKDNEELKVKNARLLEALKKVKRERDTYQRIFNARTNPEYVLKDTDED